MRRASCIGWLVVFATAMPAALAAEACVFKPARLRFDDDYLCFRDRKKREGFPGDMKFIPISEDRQVGSPSRRA